KVAFFLTKSGNRRHVLQLKALEEAGFYPLVILFNTEPEKTYFYQKGLGKKLRFLSISYEEGGRKIKLKVLRELINLLKKEKIRAVLTHRFRLLKYLYLAKFFYKDLKIIFYPVVSGELKHLGRRLAFKVIKKSISKIVVNSRALKEELCALKVVKPEEVEIIYSSVDPEEFSLDLTKFEARRYLRLPEGFYFGMVAKFRPEKDHQTLLLAFKRFLDMGGKAYLLLVGDGPTKEETVKLAKKLQISSLVIFAGEIDPLQVPLYLRTLDVYVHSSYREGMPLAVLEALSSGLPIIATEAEGLPDIFDCPYFFGYLVPKRNEVALAEAMWKIYNLPEKEREILGRNAKRRFEEDFSPEALAKNTIRLFSEIFNS
ncbi:MAG: glycosyltransferase family 4 protein, partial [Caldimicrobium thiodismutans]